MFNLSPERTAFGVRSLPRWPRVKTVFALVLTCLVLAGCDSIFIRRVELLPNHGTGGSLVPPDISRVKATVRAYAREAGLECTEVQLRNSVAVCFGAMGVPFESRKFAAQMDSMQSTLTREFGQDAVRVLQGGCPSYR